MSPARTYWHLEALGRKPTDYEVASSRLLYAAERGIQVKTPVGDWTARHASRLQCADWDRFSDPRQMRYATYVAQQRDRERFVAELWEASERDGYDAKLSAAWLRQLQALLAPVLFPLHGLQMVSAYTGSMAPSGRVAIACLFQTADEIRRIQTCAYRVRQLENTHRGFGDGAKERWQRAPEWQPLRKLIEELMVTYDFDDALIALNAVVKPALDALLLDAFASAARDAGDDVLQRALGSLAQDATWHRAWFRALMQQLVDEHESNATAISACIAAFRPRALHALEALSETCASPDRPGAAVLARADALLARDCNALLSAREAA